jgi:hypothetical protein
MQSIDKNNKKGYTGLWNVFFLEKVRNWNESLKSHTSSLQMNSLKHQRPTRAGRKETMFSAFNALRGRLIIGAVFSVIILAGCGGGGSSTPTDLPPVAATADLTGTSGCVIPPNASNCNPPVGWEIKNATDPKVVLGTTTVSQSPKGTSVAQLIGYGSTTVAALDGQKTIKSVTISAECGSGFSWDGNACSQSVARYSEFKLVKLADQGGYIGMILADGKVQPLKNNSEFTVATTGAAFPLGICEVWDTKLATGWPVISCQAQGSGGNTRRNFPVDPINGSVEKEYKGVMPAGATSHGSGYGTFGDTPYAAYGVSRKGLYINTKEGVYFLTDTDRVNLRLTSDGFATSKVVATCSSIECYQYLTIFSN